MKLQQLQALVSVADHGSIRSASRAMHLSQAAVTKSLRLLEEECGVALLLRRSRGVMLTPAGDRLNARARLITRQLALAEDDLAQSLGGDTGSVRAGLSPYLMLMVLGQAVQWFRRRYAATELRLVEGLVARVLPAMRDGSLDFAIVADSGDVPRGEFVCTPLHNDMQKLVVRAGHPVLESPSPDQVASLEWVVPGPFSQGLDAGTLAMFKQAGVAPPSRITRCDAMAALGLVRGSDTVTLMPAPLLRQPACSGLVELKVPGMRPADACLVLITAPDVLLTPAAAYLARCLTDAISTQSVR